MRRVVVPDRRLQDQSTSMEEILNGILGGLSSWLLVTALVAALALLTKGADWFVEGAAGLAGQLGLSKIIIGATVVSVGTTMPECVVSVLGAWMGKPELALGNAVGSIIANAGLIFGVCCLFAAIPLDRFVLNRHGWIQMGAAVLLVILAIVLRGTIPRRVGVGLVLLLAAYLYVSVRWARQYARRSSVAARHIAEEISEIAPPQGFARETIMIVAGLLLVLLGSRIVISCVQELALRIGVPEDILAVSLVALGTSLPELVTGVTSVAKGHSEIMLGNVIGANILNVLFVVGFAATARPLAVPVTFFLLHFPVMLTILLLFRLYIFSSRLTFHRWQGGLLLGIYTTYIVALYVFGLGGQLAGK